MVTLALFEETFFRDGEEITDQARASDNQDGVIQGLNSSDSEFELVGIDVGEKLRKGNQSKVLIDFGTQDWQGVIQAKIGKVSKEPNVQQSQGNSTDSGIFE